MMLFWCQAISAEEKNALRSVLKTIGRRISYHMKQVAPDAKSWAFHGETGISKRGNCPQIAAWMPRQSFSQRHGKEAGATKRRFIEAAPRAAVEKAFVESAGNIFAREFCGLVAVAPG